MKDSKWAILGVVVVFVGVAVAAVIVSKPESEPSANTDITQTTNDNETSLQVNDGTDVAEQEGEQQVLAGKTLQDFEPVNDVEELQIIDLVEGDGEEATADSTVTAHYTGAFTSNGLIFQSSKDTGSTFTSPLSGLIAGWQEGIPGMKVGGTRRLIIPGNLAYGEAPEGYEPSLSGSPLGPLVFDIELVAIDN